MAKEGKKLELYEILAAKRAKGKAPLGLDAKTAKQANTPPEPDPEIMDRPGVIIDDAVGGELGYAPVEEQPSVEVPPPPRPEVRERSDHEEAEPKKTWFKGSKPQPAPRPQSVVQEYVEPDPLPPPRPKSPREVVFSLDSALFFFVIVLVLIGTSFLVGYKRGQEEKPAGLAGVSELEVMDGDRLGIRSLTPPPRSSIRPPEHGFTLILRREPGTDELPERLEYELAEALAKGRKEAGRDFPGFIFRTEGNDYILAVGLGKSSNDPDLDRLYQIYNAMEGITLSRQPRPYLGCRVAPISELGTPVF